MSKQLTKVIGLCILAIINVYYYIIEKLLLTGGVEGVEGDVSALVEDNAWCVGAQLGQEKPNTQTQTFHTDLQIMDFLLSNLFHIDGGLGRGLNRISGLSWVLRN